MKNKIKTGVIITDDKNRVLLIKEKIKKNDKALWNIIKGSYGDRRENIFKASQRECLEEIGVNIEIEGFQGCYVAQKDTTNYVMLIFNARITKGEPRPKTPEEQRDKNEDIKELKWFTKKEVSRIKKNDFISNRIHFIMKDWLKNNKTPLNSIKQIE
ncbi:MAG: NUDIX hydrolase [Candidatus Woesearchaeota archaeon]